VRARGRGLDPQAQLQAALDLSFRFLGHRDRTVAEVRRHLERRRMEPAAIDAAVAELERQGYLDDARFARRFAEDRRTLDRARRLSRPSARHGARPQRVDRRSPGAVAGRWPPRGRIARTPPGYYDPGQRPTAQEGRKSQEITQFRITGSFSFDASS
jgi:regulatory protein